MAAGAGDVRLQLGVTLDLAGFRQQLAAAARAAASFSYPINFDKRNLDRQFAALDKRFKTRNYRLEIITNFAAEIENANKLISKIQQVKQAAQGSTGGGVGSPVALVNTAPLNRPPTRKGVGKDDIKALYESLAIAGVEGFKRGAKKTRPEMIAEIGAIGQDVIAGILNGLKSGDAALEAAAKNLGTTLITTFKTLLGIASPSKVFRGFGEDVGKGFEQGALSSMDKAFDALERQLRQRLVVLQGMMTGGKGAFPFVAKTGPIEQRALFAESASLARKIDQTRAEISQIQARRESRLTFQRESLAQVAGRLLPAARDRSLPAARATVLPGGTVTEQALQEFFRSLRNAQNFLARNFSANTYLPRASRQFAASMSESARLLRGQRIAGLLPSREMLEPLKFQRAIQAAQRIDAANAFRGIMSRPLLPAAGATGATAAARATLSGQRFRAPGFGRGDTGQPGAAMDQSGPIADRLRQAAVNFSKNAPAVIKYLNLFSTAGGINIGDLPGAGESPGQYIRRIQESLRLQLKQGGFGAGQVPSRTEFFRPGQGPQLPGMPLQLRLPPAGGLGGGDRVRGTGQPPQRGGAIVPYAPATRLPGGYFENVRKYAAALEMARATMNKFSASQLPFIGGLQGLAMEFGEATKQVLLYGTAYKALAFVTNLPGQIINAAKGQQQYNNALQTATQDTGTYAKELLYVNNIQRTFGLDLETTRQGFVRLFASMGPAGFDSGSIEKLFTGISAATAALQLTPDKAERVIYAFGQMASKGQIMSEELKGQLGDVLPGALALFAKAAGMSVKQFSKEMEDGAFTGNRFREVFAKVSDELINRFGTGAQAAGRSMQGLINAVGGDFKRTLESLAPLADSAAQAVLGPLASSLKQLSTSAQIATGEIERTFAQLQQAQKDVGDLRAGGASADEIRAAEQNVAALTVRYKALQEAAKDPAIAKQAADIEKFTEELAKAGTFVMNVAKAIGSALSPILNLLGTNLTTTIALLSSFYIGFQAARLAAMALMGALLLYRGLSTLLGLGAAATQATALAGAFNVLGVAATGATVKTVGLRTALIALTASTVVGVVVAGITAIAGAFATMRDRAQEAGQASREASKAAVDAARYGRVAEAEMAVQTILAEGRKAEAARKALEAIFKRSTKAQRQGIERMPISTEEVLALRGVPLTEGVIKEAKGGVRMAKPPTPGEMTSLLAQFGSLAGEIKLRLKEAMTSVSIAKETAKITGQNQPMPGRPGAEEIDPRILKEKNKEAIELNQALQVELENRHKLYEIGKDELSTLSAKLDLAARLYALQKEEIILSEKGAVRQQKLKNAELAYQAIVADTKEKQKGVEAKIKDVYLQATELFNKITGQNMPSKTPFEEMLINVKKETIDNIQAVNGLLKLLQELVGSNPKYEALTASLQSMLDYLSKMTPEKEAAAGRRRTAEPLQERLQERLIEMQQAGLPISEERRTREDLRVAGIDQTTLEAKQIIELSRQVDLARPFSEAAEAIGQVRDELTRLTDSRLQIISMGDAIGSSFGNAFKGMISGSMTAQQAFAGFFQSVADSFLDMAAKMIAKWIQMQIIGLAQQFLPGFFGLGSFAGGAGFGKSVGLPSGVGMGAGSGIIQNSMGQGFGTLGPNFGFRQFANGGIVTGPTMGLIGEGRYNEAVVPLPNGRSIPVELGGASAATNVIVNVDAKGTSVAGDQGAAQSLAKDLASVVDQRIIYHKRAGGLLSR